MAGEIREPLAGLVTTRMATLQEKIMESHTGVWKHNAVSREKDVFDTTDHSSRPWIRQQMQLIHARQKAADVFSSVGSVVYAVVKRPYLVLPVFALAACSVFGGKTGVVETPVSSPHMTETIPAPTDISPPTETPIPTPTFSGNVEDKELGVSFETHTPPGGIMLLDEDLYFYPINNKDGKSLGNVFPFVLEVDSRLGWKENVAFNSSSENISSDMRLGTFSTVLEYSFTNANGNPMKTDADYWKAVSMFTEFFDGGKTMKITINGTVLYWAPKDGLISRLVQKGALDPNDPLVLSTTETLWKVEVVNKRLITTTEVANLNEMSDSDTLENIFAPLGEVFLYKGEVPKTIKHFSGGEKDARVFAMQAGGSRVIGNETVFGPIMFVSRSDLISSPSPTPTPSPSANSNMVVASRR